MSQPRVSLCSKPAELLQTVILQLESLWVYILSVVVDNFRNTVRINQNNPTLTPERVTVVPPRIFICFTKWTYWT